MRNLMMILLAAASLAAFTAQADTGKFVEKAASPALINELRQGGFVLYMRHGNTNNSIPDRVPDVDLNDCSTQRPLNEEGRQVAKRVGQMIRKAGIPVGEILVSPMCRAKESAMAAFGRIDKAEFLLKYSSNMPSSEKAPALEYLKQQLLRPVPKGTNRVLLAHAPNLMDLIGYFPKPEATVTVFRQTAQGYQYEASIHPEHWDGLLK